LGNYRSFCRNISTGTVANPKLKTIAACVKCLTCGSDGFVRGPFPDHFRAFERLMNKDFRLVLEKAATLGVLMPATAASYGINREEFSRQNEEDFSAVVRRMEDLSRLF
jgi:3-hydroxyisobutyrate dehydrogenase-like beta-hydroxyacid dehydrogenase